MSETLKPNMLTRLKQKMTQKIKGKYMIFRGSEENYVRHGAWVLEESIDLFHGKTNPVGHLSVDDLNNMNVDRIPCYKESYSLYNLYQGSWEGRVVLVKKYIRDTMHLAERILREIVVATQMASHNHAHKILGYCLETDLPVVVYEWIPLETLHDRIFLNDQSKAVLEWKDRLRIAWEISHVVAFLHTAFPSPIIHRDLHPGNVFLDQNNAAKLGDFSCSVSIPEGEEFVDVEVVIGTFGYIDPDYLLSNCVAKSTDVYSFGMLLLVLLTGKRSIFKEGSIEECFHLYSWVQDRIKIDCVNEIVDPAITRNGVTSIEDLQQRAFAQLAFRCITLETDYRPTMVEVATELRNMITSPEFIPTATNFQDTNYDMFNSVNEQSDIEEHQLKILEKDTVILEPEVEQKNRDENIKKLLLKKENLEGDIQDMKNELFEMRIELMKCLRNEKILFMALLFSWIFFILGVVFSVK